MAGAELIGKEEIKEVMDVLRTGVFARYAFDKERQGIWKVRDFEKAFAKYCGSQYALGVTSGSAALKIALTALDVGPGDEVICPAFTFMATYEAVLEVGGIPVMADIDDTLNLDPDDIANKITPRTKAVIPVHMCGSPARIDKIMKVARKHKLLVLEDNAQGLGASFKGKKLGSFGHMGIFSFDHYKTMTTGEGGMVITNDLDLYHRAEWYHDHGHDHLSPVSRALDGRTILGFNFRMNEFQGAVGLAQLRKLNRVIAAQRKEPGGDHGDVRPDPRAEVPGGSRSRGGFGDVSGLQPPQGGADEDLPEGAQGRGDRHGPLQGQFLALRPQLGALPGQVHGELEEEPLLRPAEPEGDLQPQGDPPRG